MSFIFNSPVLKQLRRRLRRSSTPHEVVLWRNLRNRRLANIKFFRQYSVGPHVVDFYAPTLNLAIEIDGGQHNQELQTISDNARTNYLKSQGITVLRFWNNEVQNNLPGVVDKILEKIEFLTPPAPPLKN